VGTCSSRQRGENVVKPYHRVSDFHDGQRRACAGVERDLIGA
jgi:hypothetical protein